MNSIRQQMRSMLHTEPREDGFRATLTADASLSILPDHFSGQPILPGMCLIQAVLLAGAMAHGDDDWRMLSMKTAKWLAPIQPGDVVTIDANVTEIAEAFVIKAKLSKAGQKAAEFSLTAVVVQSTSFGARPHPNLLPEGDGTGNRPPSSSHLKFECTTPSLPPGESRSEGERRSTPVRAKDGATQ